MNLTRTSNNNPQNTYIEWQFINPLNGNTEFLYQRKDETFQQAVNQIPRQGLYDEDGNFSTNNELHDGLLAAYQELLS